MIDFKNILTVHKFLIVGSLIFFGLYTGVDNLLLTPLKNDLSVTKSEIKKMSSDRQNFVREIEALRTKGIYLKEKEEQLTNYFIMKSKLVDFSSSSDFFARLVNYNGIKVDLLKPGKKEQVSQFVKWQINITAKGSYDNIYGYLDYLGNLPYVVNVKRLDFAKTELKGMNKINLTVEAIGR
jgi:Tfp pilus assembly protein PilO